MRARPATMSQTITTTAAAICRYSHCPNATIDHHLPPLLHPSMPPRANLSTDRYSPCLLFLVGISCGFKSQFRRNWPCGVAVWEKHWKKERKKKRLTRLFGMSFLSWGWMHAPSCCAKWQHNPVGWSAGWGQRHATNHLDNRRFWYFVSLPEDWPCNTCAK